MELIIEQLLFPRKWTTAQFEYDWIFIIHDCLIFEEK